MKFAALLILSCVVAAMGQNFQWSFLGSPMKPINEEKPEVDALNFQDTNRPNNRNIPYGRQPHLSHEYLFNPFLNPSWEPKSTGSDPATRADQVDARINSQKRILNWNWGFGSTTTTLTVTTVSAASCIPATLFTSSNNMVSTTPCARRRRQVGDMNGLLEASYDVISPSHVERLTPSHLPDLQERQLEPMEILSSKEEQIHLASTGNLKLRGRQLNIGVTTITSFVFTPTLIKKTVSLGSNLVCLPSPYVVC